MRARALKVVVILVVVLLMLLAVACDDATPSEEPTERERVRISGSGTAMPLLRILTAEYDSDEVEFVYLPGLHSGGGVKGVYGGDLEIGSVSRELTPEEQELGLRLTWLSQDGLVIAVHPSVDVGGLTRQQVKDIYSGAYTNWNELGGPDLLITILDRNEDESAKIILRQYVLGPDVEITPRAVNLYYESDMVEALQSTQGAIGYFSLGYGLSQNVNVRYLDLDGVAPSVANIRNGSYQMVRPLGVVTKEDPGPRIEAFLEWATSDEGVDLIEDKGFAAASR